MGRGRRPGPASRCGPVPPFASRHKPLELLEIVRQVSTLANPVAPTDVSGREWDAHRAAAGFPDAPLAFSISKRFGISWAGVLTAAHVSEENRWRRLTHLQADKGRKGLDLPAVSVALRQAARRLEKPGIDRSDYGEARELILRASRGTRQAAIAARALPELTQIEEILRRHRITWEQGLLNAGLDKPARSDNSGLSLEDGINAFVEDTGCLPLHYHQLYRWAISRRISLSFPRKSPGAATQQAIDQVIAARARAGLAPLSRAPRDLPLDRVPDAVDTRHLGPRARRQRWDRESLINGLALAVELLGPGRQLDQRSLKRVAVEHGHLPIPSYSVVNRHLRRNHPDESWEQWRQEAEARARRGQPTTK